ncbi:MAG TPA: SufS family cysteine desulfurase [Thermoplasmata archaeon]|nr:SufS family cysteine desulfurase [Thermoplasmata archaeon]
MDVDAVRRDFPVLGRTFHGHPIAYLDSAATSQKPQVVIDAEADFYQRLNANVHRGVYALSEEATDAYERARERVARFLHARDPAEVVFVRGTTEGLNAVATSLGRGVLERGDRVISTVMEHHSNIVPWHLLRESHGIDLEFVDIDDDGRLRLDDLDRLLTPRTKVVTVTHVSNVLGTVNPIREIADRAHAVGALVVVDAAQSAPHRPIDVAALGCDLLAFSGHKTLGPTGIGALWGRQELLDRLPPAMGGGEMIREVHLDRVSYRESPTRFEAGTPNVGGAVALHRALDYLEGIGWETLADHERRLATHAFDRARDGLGPRLTIFGPPTLADREAVLSFRLEGVHPHDIASLLDADGVCVRSGHHCAQPLMERLHVPALTRASPYLYNTIEEIDRLFDGLERVARVFDVPAPDRSRATAPVGGTVRPA